MKNSTYFGPPSFRDGWIRVVCYWQDSFLPAFFRWWREQLLACLPNRVQQALTVSNNEVLLYWRNGQLWDMQGEHAQALSKDLSTMSPKRVMLLPAETALTRRIYLPKAAVHDLTAVLTFELDKFMPFSARQVYFDIEKPVASVGSNLTMRLVVIRREPFDALLNDLARAGHRIDAVDVLSVDGQRLQVNLLPASRKAVRQAPQRWLNRGLITLVLGLVVSAMLLWVHSSEALLETMRTQVKKIRAEALQVQVLRQQLNSAREIGQFVLARKTEAPYMSGLLNELSRCIPGTTWLEQLEISAEGQVKLNGQSSQASELITDMGHCPSLSDIQFQGIIQADAVTGKDRFYLRAQLRQKEADHARSP